MHEFLLEFYRPWPEVVGEDRPPIFSPPTTDPTFAHGACVVGFDYGGIGLIEREYNFALVRWMALQVGRRRRRFRGEGVTLEKPVAYVVVGGYEPWPVLLDTEWPDFPVDMRWWVTDQLGMNTDDYVVRELAWYHIPANAHTMITATHHGRSSEEVREALIQSGLEGAQQTLHIIRAQIARLDLLWRDT